MPLVPIRLSSLKASRLPCRPLFQIQSESVRLSRVKVNHLFSDEGDVTGIELSADPLDRQDYANRIAARFHKVHVGELRGSTGYTTIPLKAGANQLKIGNGFSSDAPPDLGAQSRQAKHTILYNYHQQKAASFLENINFNASHVVEAIKATTDLKTDEAILAFRRKAMGFFKKQYGVTFVDENVPLAAPVFIVGSDSFLGPPGSFVEGYPYKATAYCSRDSGCVPLNGARIHDL